MLVNKLSQLLCWLAIKLIHGYRLILSPWIGNQCRFYPSCSHYSEIAIKKYGLLIGAYLTLRRLLKCHPWHKGGIDLVPQYKKTCCTRLHSPSIDGSK
jgi:putative membrane protein insertion efficiency factor